MTLKKALADCVLLKSEASMSHLYKKYYGYLMAISLRYFKNDMDAEDVVNESFIKIFNKIANFSHQDSEDTLEKAFKGWIARITVNTTIDRLRLKKEVLSLDDIFSEDLAKNAVFSANTLDVKDILKLLEYLPKIQRTIFNLYEIEGYSHEEISKMLSIPESTSRTYLTRAKSKLRMLYQENFMQIA